MIHFLLNNKTIKTTCHPGVTLLDFIRDYQQLKGTKTGCREGDCGACTVLVGTYDDDRVTYQSITSCISPLGNANRKHIVTVEGINLPHALNAVQEAMTENHGTQCGFCTPGFVVSMTGFALKHDHDRNITENTCTDAVSGNICRCTGYKSIEKACYAIEDRLQKKSDQQSIPWLIREGFIPEYFESIPQRLMEIQSPSGDEDSVATQRQEKGLMQGITVANGTDIYVHQADLLAEEQVHLLDGKGALKGIAISDGVCSLGANTTVTEIAENEQLQAVFPKLNPFLKLVSSEQIRNMGTLGGNFVNASPIGDMSIFFLALDATLTIQNNHGTERHIPFPSFHQAYKVYDLGNNEFIKEISIPVPKANQFFNFEKVSKRTHLDIASVNSAASITIQDSVITKAHIAIGGVAAIPKYLKKTNAHLEGKAVSSKHIREAVTILQSEIAPISDVRGSAEYKRLLAQQLFFAHFIELFPDQVSLEKLIAR